MEQALGRVTEEIINEDDGRITIDASPACSGTTTTTAVIPQTNDEVDDPCYDSDAETPCEWASVSRATLQDGQIIKAGYLMKKGERLKVHVVTNCISKLAGSDTWTGLGGLDWIGLESDSRLAAQNIRESTEWTTQLAQKADSGTHDCVCLPLRTPRANILLATNTNEQELVLSTRTASGEVKEHWPRRFVLPTPSNQTSVHSGASDNNYCQSMSYGS